MKLFFLKEDALAQLKGNIKANLHNYANPTNDWIPKCVDMETPFLEYKKEVTDFSLDMSAEKPNTTDLENVKRLYSAMRILTETDACDERLWSGLAHGQMWEFMRYRCQNEDVPLNTRHIEACYFYGYGIRRSCLRNNLAKLWWVGKLTYDECRKNPFELTDVLSKDFTTRVTDLLDSNLYTGNPVICKAFLSAIKNLEAQGISVNRELFRKATQYLNVLGGTYILDCLTEEELTEKITRRINNFL